MLESLSSLEAKLLSVLVLLKCLGCTVANTPLRLRGFVPLATTELSSCDLKGGRLEECASFLERNLETWL